MSDRRMTINSNLVYLCLSTYLSNLQPPPRQHISRSFQKLLKFLIEKKQKNIRSLKKQTAELKKNNNRIWLSPYGSLPLCAIHACTLPSFFTALCPDRTARLLTALAMWAPWWPTSTELWSTEGSSCTPPTSRAPRAR